MNKLTQLQPNEGELMFEGYLSHIKYPKGRKIVEADEFAIFEMRISKWLTDGPNIDKISIKGKPCRLEPNVKYKVTCVLCETSEKYGNTYQLHFANRYAKLDTKEEQEEFLLNVLNPKLTGALFDMYEDVISLLENREIDSLMKVKGIGIKTAIKMCDSYEETKDYSELFVELADLQPTHKLINKLIERYHSPSAIIDAIKKNPYQLTEIDGFGFKKADNFALKMNIERDDPRRVRAFYVYYLEEQGNSGKSWLSSQELDSALNETIGYIPQKIKNQAARSLIEDNTVIIFNRGQRIALKRFYELERNICKELIRLQFGENGKAPKKLDPGDWECTLQEVEEEQGYPFSEEQLYAVELSITNNVLAITGLAGAGKTSSANGICAIFDRYSIVCCALAGKASVRMTEATGRPAGTIHRTLCYKNGKFEHNKENPLKADIVLLDESTMVNGRLFLDLLSAIPTGTKVILMGDVQQLTPIGNCQVFSDILNSNVIPVARLTKPHRQALKSGIIPTSIHVAKQEQIFDSQFTGNKILGNLQDMELEITKDRDHLQDLIVKHFKKEMDKFKDIMEVQICVPRKQGGALSCMELNKRIQNIYNPKQSNDDPEIRIQYGKKEEDFYVIREGDKVINQKNNYKCYTESGEKVAVFNGNIGIVQEINEEECIIDFVGIGIVVFDRKTTDKLALAYACTVHKLQGSGFKSVIVGIDNGSFIMNNSELLYTALTRAKNYCTLVGQNGAVRSAIRTKETKVKQTFLKEMLPLAAAEYNFAA